jgi:hypothetical protein
MNIHSKEFDNLLNQIEHYHRLHLKNSIGKALYIAPINMYLCFFSSI